LPIHLATEMVWEFGGQKAIAKFRARKRRSFRCAGLVKNIFAPTEAGANAPLPQAKLIRETQSHARAGEAQLVPTIGREVRPLAKKIAPHSPSSLQKKPPPKRGQVFGRNCLPQGGDGFNWCLAPRLRFDHC
jgi:hypothetical protein